MNFIKIEGLQDAQWRCVEAVVFLTELSWCVEWGRK